MKLLSRINKLPLFPVQVYWKDWTGDLDGIAKGLMGVVTTIKCIAHDEGMNNDRVFPQYVWTS